MYSIKDEFQKLLFIISLITLITSYNLSFAANKVFYYHTDAAGTPMAMTDENGDVVWEADYMPFGEEYELNETVKNRQRFIGKEKDEETDLYYFGARYLDGRTGRFIKPDPVGITEADLLNPQRFNRYSYSLNNPYRYVDPDGRLTVHIWNYQGIKVALGHASITLENGAHISWWPGEDREGKLYKNIYSASANDPQKFPDDVRGEDKRQPDYQIKIIGLDEKKIEDWWEKFRSLNQWKTLTQNCATTAADALKARGGADKASWLKSHNIIWTPNDVKEFANDINDHLTRDDKRKQL